MSSLRFFLACMAGISFVTAAIVGVFVSRLEVPLIHLWANLFNKSLPGPKPTGRHYTTWIGFIVFLCLGSTSTALSVLLDNSATAVTPIITVVAPTVEPFTTFVTDQPTSFIPFVEEFTDSKEFTQTTNHIYLNDSEVSCNVSRNGGDQFIYRKIPNIKGDLQLTVVGQVNDWTNNCQCQIGIGNEVGKGIGIGFGFFGGGCTSQGALVTPIGEVSQPWFADSCEDMGRWSWISARTPYRVSLVVKGAAVTFFVEGVEVDKYFTTTTYTQAYNTLWVGLKGDGDWPECSATFNSVTIEPIK